MASADVMTRRSQGRQKGSGGTHGAQIALTVSLSMHVLACKWYVFAYACVCVSCVCACFCVCRVCAHVSVCVVCVRMFLCVLCVCACFCVCCVCVHISVCVCVFACECKCAFVYTPADYLVHTAVVLYIYIWHVGL